MSLIDNNWKPLLDLQQKKEIFYREFHSNVTNYFDEINNLLDEEILDQNCSNRGAESQKPNIDLKVLVEQNRQFKADIDSKLEELNKKQLEYESYKQDRKLLSQEIKETHEAFLTAKKYYKKFLKIYYTIENSTETHQTVYLQFFTETKKDNENYSVRLQRDVKTRHYKLLETTPVLKNGKDIIKYLEESSDIPGTLFLIRESFLKIKSYVRN